MLLKRIIFLTFIFLSFCDIHASRNRQVTFKVDSVSFTMTKVKGGSFIMGATEEQGDDVYSCEKPTHQVTLSDYYIGTTEVTQSLWTAVMGEKFKKCGYGLGDDYPVYDVSWNDAQIFLQKLNAKTGKNFRLPTEAEWEYAARGGKKSRHYKYAGSNDLNEVAWYWENSGDKKVNCSPKRYGKLKENHNQTHPVATKKPNELGIYDMCGNVEEWCGDDFDKCYYRYSPSINPICISRLASYKVIRGGHWKSDDTIACRISYRSKPVSYKCCTGFRLALSSRGQVDMKDSVHIIKKETERIFPGNTFYENVNQPKRCASEDQIPTLVPKEYCFEDYWTQGDFDGDGLGDYMVCVCDSNSSRYEYDTYYAYLDGNKSVEKDTLIDRNPRGYLLVMNRGSYFEVTSYNYECFPSENEDGGVYFAPELNVSYDSQSHQLHVSYFHGRYGGWEYHFKYHDGEFELVRETRDESVSLIAETTRFVDIDYEKGIAKYSVLVNENEFYDYEDGDEYPKPIYEDSEEEIEKTNLVKMSERSDW